MVMILDFIKSSESLNEKIKTVADNKNIPLKIGKTITSDVFDLYSSSLDEFKSNFPDEDFLSVEMEAFGLFYMANRFRKGSIMFNDCCRFFL